MVSVISVIRRTTLTMIRCLEAALLLLVSHFRKGPFSAINSCRSRMNVELLAFDFVVSSESLL